MHRVIIWGAGDDYQSLYNLIKYEELKGNIEIVAIADRFAWQERIDGYKVILPDDIKNNTFDYVIISSSKYYDEIVAEALKMGINRDYLIKGSVLRIPCFDFTDYAQLKENSVSIISDNCWGGVLYHYLDLPFMSPFINFWIPNSDFVKMVSDLEGYMSCPLSMERQGDMRNYPIGSLEIGGEKVFFYFCHHDTFEEAQNDFERRKSRINWNNLFIKMHYAKGYIHSKHSIEDIARFEKIPYEKKVCLSLYRTETIASFPSVLIQNSFRHDYPEWDYDSRNFVDYAVHPQRLSREYNIFKLLLRGEKVARFEEK